MNTVCFSCEGEIILIILLLPLDPPPLHQDHLHAAHSWHADEPDVTLEPPDDFNGSNVD